jgi:hypothetical protein
MTSQNFTYLSPIHYLPTLAGRSWQDARVNTLVSESAKKSDSTVKIKVSSDNHEGKSQVSLQIFLDYSKEREKRSRYTREFGNQPYARKTDKSNLN